MMSHYYEFQVLLIPRLPQSLVVTFRGVGGDLYACVRARVCARVCVCRCPYMREGGLLEKEKVWTKKGGSIIGFSTARRHNDTAIDSGMSSREQWTNGRAGVCFSQPLIGWPREAVGLQVAKWTSEQICHPSTSWRIDEGREGVLDVEEEIWPRLWREENNEFTWTRHIIYYILYVSSPLLFPHPFYTEPSIFSFTLTLKVCACVRAHLSGRCWHP